MISTRAPSQNSHQLQDSSPGHLTLQVFTGVEELEKLRQIWEAWQEHPNSVMDNYLSQFAENPQVQPYVMALYRGGRPDCLLIGKQLPRGVASAVSKFLQPAHRTLYFVEGGFLGSRSQENCEFLIRRIVAELGHGEADAAEFCGLGLDSPLYDAATKVPGVFGRDYFPIRLVHRYLHLPATFQEFLAGLPGKERQNLAYHQKLLLKTFRDQVEVRKFRTEADDVNRLIEDADQIAQKTYQRGLGRGFTLADSQVLRSEARNGSLRAYVLYIQEKPSAYLIASWHKGVFYGRFMGYDPEYRRYAPGKFLLMRCIEECFANDSSQKTVMLDPGPGDVHYKRYFTNMEIREAHVTIHPPHLRGFLCNVVRSTRFSAIHCAKVALEKTRLLQVVLQSRRRRALANRQSTEALSSGRVKTDRAQQSARAAMLSKHK